MVNIVNLFVGIHEGGTLMGGGPTDIWAVGIDSLGNGAILHWNGAAWLGMASGTTSYLTGVWGSGASDVWAVGYAEDGNATILRYQP